MATEQVKPSICFVTNELYPLRKGGIGRMLYNFARQNAASGQPAEIHFLVPPDLVSEAGAEAQLSQALDGLGELHVTPALNLLPDAEAHLFDRASFNPWSLELLVSTSYRYYRALLDIERQRGQPLDFIEFPDFGGWGLATVEAKRAGIAFQNTLISARLHSTQGMIARAERFFDPSEWNGVLVDAERHLLTHADLIVGHVQCIIDENADHYGLRDRWAGRTVLEFPPILLEKSETLPPAEPDVDGARDFIFSSRLQPFKRPDIFVRAAIRFLEKHPEYDGMFRLVSYGWDHDYITWLERLVPDHFRQQIVFITDATAAERNAFLASSIAVIPSDFESLCLFAFEVAQRQRPVLLNRRCKAFGQNPRWHDTENCLLFDGTPEALAATMEQALTWQPKTRVNATPDAPYWQDPAWSLKAEAPPSGRASLSVVFCDITDRATFRTHMMKAAFLENVLDLAGQDELVVLLPHGLSDPQADEIRALTDRGWTVMWAAAGEECPEAFGQRLAELRGDCVLIYPAGYDVDAGFVVSGLHAMHRNPELSILGGHLAIDDATSGQAVALRAYGGEMPSHALTASRIAPVPSLIRRTLLERRHFDPRAGKFWFEVFVRDCAIDGEPMLITPQLAANLPSTAVQAQDTTGKTSAGVMDRAGLQAGLRGRLLALDTGQNSDSFYNKVQTLSGPTLAGARRIRPAEFSHGWEPVQYLIERQALMVHPLKDEAITIAELAAPAGRFWQLTAFVRNLNDENDGVEAAIACIPPELGNDWVNAVLDQRISSAPRFSTSLWTAVGGNQTAELKLSLLGSTPESRFLLMSRLPAGAREYKAHLVFENLTLW